MANEYSMDDLQDFLGHASDKGLMPAATATALGVASRTVFAVLTGDEREDLRQLELEDVIKRFTNKRAKDFNPSTLKEYGRRIHRAVDLFLSWREDPANFTVKTRSAPSARSKDHASKSKPAPAATSERAVRLPQDDDGYQSAFPIRPGTVVTLSNIPDDLTHAEAERLAKFVRMLAME